MSPELERARRIGIWYHGAMSKSRPSPKLRRATEEIADGVVHKMLADLRKALIQTPAARATWEDITPLARNEWICWVTSGKKAQTRIIRIKKALSKLKSGMRRPCCWAGCPHRPK